MSYCVPAGIPHSKFLSWDLDDQDKALAFLRERNKVCGNCGTREEEWKANRFAYISDAWQCPGCELLEMERENIPDGYKGVKVFLVKNDPDTETSDGLDPVG